MCGGGGGGGVGGGCVCVCVGGGGVCVCPKTNKTQFVKNFGLFFNSSHSK